MPGGTNSRLLCGEEWKDRTIALNRGACVHYAHQHAGSFLIPRALKLASEDFGWRVFIAYSDAEAGEIGTIYQACNWLYLGTGNGRGKQGHYRFRKKGTDEWLSSRVIRRRGLRQADLRNDPDWEVDVTKAKGRYVQFTGTKPERKAARKALRYEPQPYPKRGA